VAQASLPASRRAVAETSTEPANELTTLTHELEAARLGLEETEELTRRVFGQDRVGQWLGRMLHGRRWPCP
jgi:hypothetical protein